MRVLEAARLGLLKIIEKPNGDVEVIGKNKADIDRIKASFDKRRRKMDKRLALNAGVR